jgi:hypothetical protein
MSLFEWSMRVSGYPWREYLILTNQRSPETIEVYRGGGVGVRALCVLAALACTTVVAESQGRVGDLTRVVRLEDCTPRDTVRKAPGDAVRVTRGQGNAVSLKPVALVSLLDQVQVKRRVDARVVATGTEGFGRGTITFAPELGTCTAFAGEFQRRGRRLGGSQEGVYTLTSRTERVGTRDSTRLLIALDYGGVIVDWKGGLVSIVALGREIQLRGTRVAVAIDSASSEAFVMVREGSVLLVGVPGVAARAVNAGRVARFGRTFTDAADAPIGDELVNNERYHAETVFDAPVYPEGLSFGKALSRALIVGGIGYGGYYAYDKWIRPKPKTNQFINGRIIVRIPI